MMTLLTSGLLLCTGMTNTYDVYLSIDTQNKSVTGTLMDSEGVYGSVEIAFDNLKQTNNCFASDDIKVCLSPQNDTATLELSVRDVMGSVSYLEQGELDCK